MIRTLNPRWREARFEAFAIFFIPRCDRSLNCINEYTTDHIQRWMSERIVFTPYFQRGEKRSPDGIGMNRSARRRSAKLFEQSQGLDIVLYKDVPLYLFIFKMTVQVYILLDVAV